MEHSSFLCELLSAYCVAITGQDLGCEQTKLNPVPGFPCGHSTIGASGRCAVTTCCMLGTVQTQREAVKKPGMTTLLSHPSVSLLRAGSPSTLRITFLLPI